MFSRCLLPGFLTLLICPALLSGQTLHVNNIDVRGNGLAHAFQDCQPFGGQETLGHSLMQVYPGGSTWYGLPVDYLAEAGYRASVVTICGEVFAKNDSYVTVEGDGSNIMNIEWRNWASVFSEIEPQFVATAHNTLEFDIDVEILPGPGAPLGQQVFLFVNYAMTGATVTEHEALNEDPVELETRFYLVNVNIIAGQLDFLPPGHNNYITVANATVIKAHVGDVIELRLISNISAEIHIPGMDMGGYMRDFARAKLEGLFTLSFEPASYHYVLPPQAPRIEFSVDIGSDAEMSDPKQDGNEVFDPGDAYVMGGPLMASPQNGIKDDAVIFGQDPAPDPFDLATIVPAGVGPYAPELYFNLNGMAAMEAALSSLTYGPGQPSIAAFDDELVFFARNLLISYDDDGPEDWSFDSFGFKSVPVNSTSPFTFSTFGTTARADEVIAVDLDPLAVPSTPFTLGTLWSEADIHPNMAPDPDLLIQDFDNDVNALNYYPDEDIEGVFYFTPSREATFVDPQNNNPLNPGSIYQLNSPGNFVEVVNPVTHLGLTNGTDINAFDFGWVFDPAEGRPGLALLFSTTVDDYNTLTNESGGLDPRMIYYSFLNGTHQAFMDEPLIDNVDAITIVPVSYHGDESFTCLEPVNPEVTVTEHEAMVEWTEPVPAPVNGYFIVLTDQGGNIVDIAGVPAGNNSVTFVNLTSNTTYVANIRSNCGLYYGNVDVAFTTLPAFLYIDGETYSSGSDSCEEGTDHIEMSNTTVENGATLKLAANESIRILPETIIEAGAEFMATIDQTGSFCAPAVLSMMEADASVSGLEEEITVHANDVPINNEWSLAVYPNPTKGSFTLELNGFDDSANTTLQIYSLRGDRIRSETLPPGQQHIIDLSGVQPGVYLVRVISGNQAGIQRIIKQ